MSGSDILGRLSRDAEVYFGVIATSHFVVLILLTVVSVGFFAPVFEFNVWKSLAPIP